MPLFPARAIRRYDVSVSENWVEECGFDGVFWKFGRDDVLRGYGGVGDNELDRSERVQVEVVDWREIVFLGDCGVDDLEMAASCKSHVCNHVC